jgi:hypothetical protein
MPARCPGQDDALAAQRARARPLPGGEVDSVMIGVRSGRRASLGPPPRRRTDLRFRVQVDSAGRVVSAELLSGSGDAGMDEHMRSNVLRQRFSPEYETRFPVPGCFLQTVPLFRGG